MTGMGVCAYYVPYVHVHVHDYTHMYSFNNFMFRFISIHGINEDEPLFSAWMSALVDIKLGTYSRPATCSLRDLLSMFRPPLNIQDQFKFLSETPNSHYDNYVLANRKLASKRIPSISLHLLYNPNNSESINTHAPTSFRQRNLYFLHMAYAKKPGYVLRCIKGRLSEQPLRQRQPLTTPKINRRRTKNPTEANVSPGLTAISPEGVTNQYQLTNGYELFKEQMMLEGVLLVRNLSEKGGRLIMNACETKSRILQFDKYVNLVFTKAPGNQLELECNCPDFKQTSGEGGLELDPQQEWMSPSTRCMHVRFIFDHLEAAIKELPDISQEGQEKHLDRLLQNLQESIYTIANTDVAVVSHAVYLVLHVTMSPGALGVFVKIHPITHDTTSTCKCTINFIRNKPDYWLHKELENFACIHIQAAVKPIHVINKFLTKKRKRTAKRKEKAEKFSKQEGKWISASLLTHRPKQRGDPMYQRYFCFQVLYTFTALTSTYALVNVHGSLLSNSLNAPSFHVQKHEVQWAIFVHIVW